MVRSMGGRSHCRTGLRHHNFDEVFGFFRLMIPTCLVSLLPQGGSIGQGMLLYRGVAAQFSFDCPKSWNSISGPRTSMPHQSFVFGEHKDACSTTLWSKYVLHDFDQALLEQVLISHIYAICHTNASVAQTAIVNQAWHATKNTALKRSCVSLDTPTKLQETKPVLTTTIIQQWHPTGLLKSHRLVAFVRQSRLASQTTGTYTTNMKLYIQMTSNDEMMK